jgi:MFS family permease
MDAIGIGTGPGPMHAVNGASGAIGGPDRRWWTLVAMCFALFMIMLDNTIVNVALPSIQRLLQTTPEYLQWTVDAYILSFAVLILLGGKLGDRFGRKQLFLVGLTIFTLASAACALASSDHQLIAARVVQGAGGALLNPLSLAILVAAFPAGRFPPPSASGPGSPASASRSARWPVGSSSSAPRGRRSSGSTFPSG